MGKMVNLSFKVPEEVHKKLKVISALSGQSMSDIVIDFVKKQKVSIPIFEDMPQKPERMKPTKTVKRKDENPDADEEVIKAEILKHKDAGLSLQKIADAMNADDIPTLRGAPGWKKGTVDGLIRKWSKDA